MFKFIKILKLNKWILIRNKWIYIIQNEKYLKLFHMRKVLFNFKQYYWRKDIQREMKLKNTSINSNPF